MNTAINNFGEKIKASADAPGEAICPYCKGTVTLRYRRRSQKPDDVSYFWRHEDHANRDCPARFKHFMINKAFMREEEF
jgi:hypothetical protein